MNLPLRVEIILNIAIINVRNHLAITAARVLRKFRLPCFETVLHNCYVHCIISFIFLGLVFFFLLRVCYVMTWAVLPKINKC